ncbi:MAG: TRAP transporter permease [Deltaproteobacteria bacterium]|nr:TRAP transporter permease [Deltaproteobacteria bacterium]MDZ4342982.1 TRAP transporter permease [Candidatus Binatia bacterium]
MTDDQSPSGKFRSLSGFASLADRTLLLLLTLSGAAWAGQLQPYLNLTFFKEQFLGLFFGLGVAGVFIRVKVHPRESGRRVPWYDWLGFAGSLLTGGYVMVMYPSIAYRLGILAPERWLLGGLAVLLILEATRRVAGSVLAGLGAVCILYTKFGYLLPGILYTQGFSWQRIATYLYLDSSGILGIPLTVAASVVVAFILFGQALYAVGGDKFITDVALIAMGRYRGGSAKVSVVSSALFGTVSGSAVANVAVDGAITIPLMKRTGYPSHLAAAIEAVASNGGQIAPPVMGAAAFLIAEFLNIPYGQVALGAAVPALLYYLALFTQVDLEAAKYKLGGLPVSQIPTWRGVMRFGWVFLIPLGFLIYALMIENWDAGQAGIMTVILTFIVGALQKETRPTFKGMVTCLEETGRTLLDIVVISALAGLVIGALQLSGLTFKLSLILVTLSGGNVYLLLGLTAIVCIFLGMSLPTAVVYITLAVLVGPALAQLGIDPLAAHLFLFYFGMLSLITPPNCLATYTAAAIAHSDFWKTGWTGMRLGIAAYIVPFAFALHPSLILKGTGGEIILAVLAASIGTFLLAVGCAGYLFRLLGWIKRGLFCVAGLLLMLPTWHGAWVLVDAAGLLLGVSLFLWERSKSSRAPSATVEPSGVTP